MFCRFLWRGNAGLGRSVLGRVKSEDAVRGALASWLVNTTPDRAVQVRALAGDIVCSWAKHFTLTVPLYT